MYQFPHSCDSDLEKYSVNKLNSKFYNFFIFNIHDHMPVPLSSVIDPHPFVF